MSGIEYLLDTNVIIGLLKGDAAAVALAEQADLSLASCAVSQITRMELLSFPGITDVEERRINAFLSNCRMLLLDESVEQETIRLRRASSLKLPDAIIAASAKVHGAALLTLDQRLKANLAKVGFGG